MSNEPPDSDFEIHVDQDCRSPAMEEPIHINQPDHSGGEAVAQQTTEPTSSTEHVDDTVSITTDSEADAVAGAATSSEDDNCHAPEAQATQQDETEDNTAEEPADLSGDSLDRLIHDGYADDREPNADWHEGSDIDQSPNHGQSEEGEHRADDQWTNSDQDSVHDSSELDYAASDTETQIDEATPIPDSSSRDRRPSFRTEALIQAAARAVVSLRQDGKGGGEEQEHDEDADESLVSSAAIENTENKDPDETIQLDHDEVMPNRPESSASRSPSSPTGQFSVGDGADNSSHHGTEDDVFSDHSPRSSIHSTDEHCENDTLGQMTEKGDPSPYARSRVTSGVSMSGASATSDLSRLSRYEKEEFIPTSRNNRPAFRSPSSVRAIQMSSPTPSVYSSPSRSAKRQPAFPTISRLGSPSVSGQYPPSRRSTPSRFKRQEAPLVLLHVTLLPLRWGYGDMVNHFETKKLAPIAFSSEGIRNLRGAWRQLQDRLGDTVLERGILLPHPQNDYEILEERLLDALELPLRRRARILECGHYLGPSNNMAISDDMEDDSECNSDAEGSEAGTKHEKRHWCKTCKGDIKYEELGSERMFRIKVYASNGLMSAGAWDACWKEMERVDVEVEPIIDASIQSDLAKLAAAFDQEQQQQLEAGQNQQAEEEQRLQLEVEQRLSLEEERHQLEVERQQFEEERRRSLEDAERRLEEERRKIEQDQRRRLEEERRQQFEEERRLLDAQRQQFEEQRLELEQQRKLVEEEQRQHLEEARRQELEEEQKLLEEQRHHLEEVRQQFEEERRQRIEEQEELRRLQREEDEQKQIAAPRSISRTSYVRDDLISPLPEATPSTDLDGRRRDSERLREIYGAHSRASSDGLTSNSSPSIHIHVDSGRQREEEQNARQLATILGPRDSGLRTDSMHEAHHPDSYTPPSPPSPSQQAYQRREDRRKSLDTASLPELLGETIRVLLQDPKNVAITVLVVLIAILAGFAKREERGVEIYKPQQQSQHHQLDSSDPAAQVIMNTPSQLVETIYKTVTSEPSPQKATVSRDVEVIYQTVTQYPSQETATRVVETIYSTVTHSLVEPRAQAAIESTEDTAAPEVASELPPAGDPSVDLNPLFFDSLDRKASIFMSASSPFIGIGLDPCICPATFHQTESGPDSNKDIFEKVAEEVFELQNREHDASALTDTHTSGEDNLNTVPTSLNEEGLGEEDTPATIPSQILSPSTITGTNTVKEARVVTRTETVTETILKTATPSIAGLELAATPSGQDEKQGKRQVAS